MISKKFACVLALAVAPVALTVTHAHGAGSDGVMPHGRVHDRFGPPPMFLAGIDLTKDQRQKIHEIFRAHRGEFHTRMEQEHALDGQISELSLTDGAIDRSKLEALFRQRDALHAAGDQAMIDDTIKIHDLLTPKQREQARTTRARIESLSAQLHDLLRPPHDGVGHDRDAQDSAPEPDGP